MQLAEYSVVLAAKNMLGVVVNPHSCERGAKSGARSEAKSGARSEAKSGAKSEATSRRSLV